MKKYILICIVLLSAFATAYSQQPQKGEKIEALRIAYITKQLQLTPDEAKTFWPVFNTYDADLKKTVKTHREKGGTQIELEEKILNLHKKYKPDFVKVISEAKFDKLIAVERTWGELIKKEIQRRRQNGDKSLDDK